MISKSSALRPVMGEPYLSVTTMPKWTRSTPARKTGCCCGATPNVEAATIANRVERIIRDPRRLEDLEGAETNYVGAERPVGIHTTETIPPFGGREHPKRDGNFCREPDPRVIPESLAIS